MPKRPTSSPAHSASPRAAEGPAGLPSRLLVGLLRTYRRVVSPLLPPSCRFSPSCSVFAQEAIELHGVARGLRLTALRLARCHPWHAGGFDPVPPTER